MKPIYLRMQAFGPYPNVQEVDFSRLGEHSLFLIHGPTGSGKTTIFDAICYALYGKTSGERSGEEMRCQYALDVLPTEILLDFELRGRTYRILRSPTQEGQKELGSGLTRSQHKAFLWDRTSVEKSEEGSLIAARPREVDTAIEDLIGFKADQFRQVIVLPQGEFRRLLLANSTEREAILETLFSTLIYKLIQERLKDKVKEIRQECDSELLKKATLLESTGCGNPNELKEKIGLESKLLEEQSLKLSVARKDYEKAQDAYGKAESTELLFHERDEAVHECRELEAQSKEMQAKEGEFKMAAKAAGLLDVRENCREKLQASADKKKELDKAEKALTSSELTFRKAQEAWAHAKELDSELQQLSEELADYKVMQPRIASLQALRGKLEAAREKLNVLEEKFRRATLQRKEKETDLRETETRIEAIQPAANSVEVLKLQVKEMSSLQKDRHKQEEAERQLSALLKDQQVASKRRVQLEKALNAAREQLAKTEAGWAQSSAYNLAVELEPGKPCPVCGSKEHPAPAGKTSCHVSDADLAQMREENQELEEAFAESREKEKDLISRVDREKEKVLDISGRLADKAGKSVKALDQEYRELSSKLERARKAASEIASCVKKQKRLKNELSKAANDLAKVEKLYRSQVQEVGKLETALKERLEGIPASLQRPGQLEEKIDRTCRRQEEIRKIQKEADKRFQDAGKYQTECQTSLKLSQKAFTAAEKQEQKAKKEFGQRLKKAEFKSEDHFDASLMEEENMQSLQSEIENYKDRVKLNKNRVKIARGKISRLKRPDLVALEKILEKKRTAYDGLSKECGALEQNVRELNKNLKAIDAISRTLAKREKDLQVVGHLAEVANGRNEQRITFHRFVLSSLLDHVTAMANERLRRMSEGRYTLHRAEETADLRQAGGLNLDVFDSYSGEQRSVKTLSGGEMFLASLSLALGLSDVVQSYSGGVALDSIFIDEGFGTLDSETLDHAIETLVLLKTAGRMVGVISHVPELRERIDARLEIKPTQQGSIIRVVGV